MNKLDDNSVRIKVQYSALNRADLLQTQGKYPNQKEPALLGLECSGHVIECGRNVENLKEGDAVMGLLDGGGYGEYVDCHAPLAMKIDENKMSLEKAGAIPETFLTAYQLLHFVGDCSPNSRVLIHGAGSGVGTAAIQLAKAAGVESIQVTAGTDKKCQKATELGADRAINYKLQIWSDEIGKNNVDLILDCIGGSYWKGNMKCLDTDGKLVLYGLMGGVKVDGPLLGIMLAKRAQIRATTLLSRSLSYKCRLCEDFSNDHKDDFYSTKLAPVIDSVYAISDVADAHRYMATNANI